MTSAFAHLHLHSEYSLVDSTLRIPELVQACELNPKNANAWYWRGEVETQHQNYAPAVEALTQVLNLESARPAVLELRAKNLRE